MHYHFMIFYLISLSPTLQQLHSEVHADARLYHTLREEAAMLDHVQELLGTNWGNLIPLNPAGWRGI